MRNDAQDAYLESRVLSADPVQLVRLLYRGCMGAVREARRYLAAGDIAARAGSIRKANEILGELTNALDARSGGDISRRLAELYDYMQRMLTTANLRQVDQPLADVLGLLTTLLEAWEGMKQVSPIPAPAAAAVPTPVPTPLENQWAGPGSQEPVSAYASHGWTL